MTSLLLRFPRIQMPGCASRCTAATFIAAATALLAGCFESAAAQTFPPATPTMAPSAIPSGALNAPQQPAQQRGLIIGGTQGNQPQPLQWQALQHPDATTSPSTLRPTSSPPGTLWNNSLGVRTSAPVASSASALGQKRASMVSSPATRSRQVKLLSQRTQIISDEARMLDAQNAVARAVRTHNTGPMPPVHSTTLLDSRANAPPRQLPIAKWRRLLARRAESSPAPDLAGAATTSGQFLAPRADLSRAAATAAQFVSPASGARRFSASAGLKHAGIWFVNNEPDGFPVTPNGYVTIQGIGFGQTPGQVNLLGTYMSGAAFSGAFKVVDWHDDEILAVLPRFIDLNDQIATVQVITHLGTTYTLGGAKFHAARDEYDLEAGIGGLVQISNNSNWDISHFGDDGYVERFDTGSSIDCKAPGTDYLYVTVPAQAKQQGYVLSGISAIFARTDSGDGDAAGHPGDRVFTPGYSLGDWTRGSPVGPVRVLQAAARGQSTQTDMIPVSWGVWRSHSAKKPPLELLSDVQDSFINALFNTMDGRLSTDGANHNRQIGPDVCLSGYKLTVSVIGPAAEYLGYELGTPQ